MGSGEDAKDQSCQNDGTGDAFKDVSAPPETCTVSDEDKTTISLFALLPESSGQPEIHSNEADPREKLDLEEDQWDSSLLQLKGDYLDRSAHAEEWNRLKTETGAQNKYLDMLMMLSGFEEPKKFFLDSLSTIRDMKRRNIPFSAGRFDVAFIGKSVAGTPF